MSNSEQQTCSEPETDAYDSDDSQQDPTFDVLEETRSSFSRLSIKRKSKPRTAKGVDEDVEVEEDVVQMVVPELDEKDQKSYQTIEKLIKAGQVEKLKVDQCKIYLRKHGLRLTGNKDTLIQRIKEHLDIIDGGGERKYPASSFVLNCKGDACTGDIVMFEQNVYEMFSIASRSATGPPCGTRVVAGRIVKESYGAAKQQHTFTIEVLWSKGEKPLPPLHPLLIKGRNLYRLKTLRQRWEDEGERQKILLEKHARGAAARSNRDARVQQREVCKMLKSNRASRTKDQYSKQENRREMPHCPSTTSEKAVNHLQQQEDTKKNQEEPDHKLKQGLYFGLLGSAPQEAAQNRPHVFMNYIPPEMLHCQRQPLINMNMESSRIPFRMHTNNQYTSFYPLVQKDSYDGRQKTDNAISSPLRGQSYGHNMNSGSEQGHNFERINSNPLRSPMRRPAYHGNTNFSTVGSPVRGQHHGRKQPCRFYAQGRCYYGDSCKYLHEVSENHHSH